MYPFHNRNLLILINYNTNLPKTSNELGHNKAIITASAQKDVCVIQFTMSFKPLYDFYNLQLQNMSYSTISTELVGFLFEPKIVAE